MRHIASRISATLALAGGFVFAVPAPAADSSPYFDTETRGRGDLWGIELSGRF